MMSSDPKNHFAHITATEPQIRPQFLALVLSRLDDHVTTKMYTAPSDQTANLE